MVVTDRKIASAPIEKTIRDVVTANPGAVMIQVREKDLPARALLALVGDIVKIARPARCPVLVNGRMDVAATAGADGVHLPEAGIGVKQARKLASALGLSQFVIGVSTHSAAAAVAAASAGADVVVLGPVWPTPRKIAFGEPLGLAAITEAATTLSRQRSRARLYAIGGIDDPARAARARQAGAFGIGVIRAVMQAENPAFATRGLAAAVTV